ncbi:hypothetical protein ID866_7381 [Astraeus odoratus]|nr:hypothetical protein ID866_7381 [Astraeus odoratus]
MNADPRIALREFAIHASRYAINLDGRVDRSDGHIVRGGYASVHLGTLRPEGMKVAIKTPRGGLPGHEETIKRFLKEVHTWSKLHHENVLPLLGMTTEFDMTVSIVSRWMTKGNARDYVQNITVDPRPLIQGIACGLYYLHNYEPGAVCHGDLKGVNVLISDDGQPLLSDFGHSFLDGFSMSLSTAGHFGGTINWMAPEVLNGGEASAAGDVWAFGMTAMELFTRKDPFHGFRGTTSIMFRILKGPPDRPSPEDTCSRLTDPWWNALYPCWNNDPFLRPSMSDIVTQIGLTVWTSVTLVIHTINSFTPDRCLAQQCKHFHPGARILIHKCINDLYIH